MKCLKAILVLVSANFVARITLADYVEDTIQIMANPYALSYDSVHNKIYCTNIHGDNVSVISGSLDSVIWTIPVGNFPTYVTYNPNGNKIYCTCWQGNTVTIIDCSSDIVIEPLAVGSEPLYLIWNLINNKAYVSNHGEGTVSVIKCWPYGVEEAKSVKYNKIQVFPNPFNASVCLPFINGEIKIYDSLGRLIERSIKNRVGENLPSGTYFLEVNGCIKVKIVKIAVALSHSG